MMKLKRLGRISVCMAVLMVMLLAAGCQKSGNSSEESANAVLNQFLAVQCRMPINLTASM